MGDCQLTRGSGVNDALGFDEQGPRSVSLQGAVTLSGATNLRVRCTSEAEGSRLQARDIAITATRIGTINGV